MPLTCFSIPSVFSCAVELALTVEYGLPVQELPDGRQVPCWDAFHESRKFVVALARLTQVLAPSGYSDPTSLRRAIELANHRPPVRKALRTLVSAITALGEHGKAKEHGRNFLSDGARRLWELMDNADRDAVADLLPLVRELWGWPDTVSSGSKAPQPGPAPECSIRLVGEVWHLRYFAETGNYPATGNKCLRWLVKLLAAPDRSLTVADLLGDPERRMAADALLGGEWETDREGIEAIKNRLEDLQEIELASGSLTESAESEKGDLLKRLERHAKSKRIVSPIANAYNNITTQIRTFRRKLRKNMPQLGAHLKASIKPEKSDFSIGYFPPRGTPPWKK